MITKMCLLGVEWSILSNIKFPLLCMWFYIFKMCKFFHESEEWHNWKLCEGNWMESNASERAKNVQIFGNECSTFSMPNNWRTCTTELADMCPGIKIFFFHKCILSYFWYCPIIFFFSFSFRSSKTYMALQHLPCQCILIKHIILLHSIYVPMM